MTAAVTTARLAFKLPGSTGPVPVKSMVAWMPVFTPGPSSEESRRLFARAVGLRFRREWRDRDRHRQRRAIVEIIDEWVTARRQPA